MSAQNIQSLSDYVLIKPLEAETKTASGIVLPETAKEKPQAGVIMAIGPGGVNEHGVKVVITLKVGQKVLYKKWAGNEVKVGHEEWLLVQEKDVMAIIN